MSARCTIEDSSDMFATYVLYETLRMIAMLIGMKQSTSIRFDDQLSSPQKADR